MARLLEGRPIADRILTSIAAEVAKLKSQPVLASIMVGDNPASQAYVKSQKKLAQQLGIDYQFYNLEPQISQPALVDFIQRLNADEKVNGIIVQLPLPLGIDGRRISQCIAYNKDVEGMHPINIGRILFGDTDIVPCTPAAVMELLKETQLNLNGKEVVVVGHSEIVGKPLALLLLKEFATVTVCHIGTSQAGMLEKHVREAEILVVAVGRPALIKGSWIKEDAVVIDVGINRIEGMIVGDVEFEEAQKRASFITPVPGGVGPLTVTMLMRNLLQAVKLQS